MTTPDVQAKKTWVLVAQRYRRLNDRLMRELSECQTLVRNQRMALDDANLAVDQCATQVARSIEVYRSLLSAGQAFDLLDLERSREAITASESAVLQAKSAAQTATAQVESAQEKLAGVTQQLSALSTRQSVCTEQIAQATQRITLADDEQSDEEAEATYSARHFVARKTESH